MAEESPCLTILVDGNNVMRALPPPRGPELAESERFLQRLELAAATQGWQVTVVFDGPERFLRRQEGLLVVRYAKPGQSADSVIERMVHEAPDRAQVVAVTQDLAEARLVMGMGATVWSVKRLLEEMGS